MDSEAGLYFELEQPRLAVVARVTKSLARLRPTRTVLHTTLESFDVEHFAWAGHCTLVPRRDVAPVFEHERGDPVGTFWSRLRHGWFDVQWGAQRAELIVLSFASDDCLVRHSWLVCDGVQHGEAFLKAVMDYDETVSGRVLVFEQNGWRKSLELAQSIAEAKLDQLVLPDRLGEQLRDDVLRFFSRRAFYEEHGIPWKRGILLLGPPGNGKTHTLKAVLREAAVPVLLVKTMRSRHGSVADNLASVFSRARKNAPCALVFEDLDCQIDEENRSLLLNELDGFARNPGVLTLASTNHPEKLDRSLLDRPSRFDRKIHFPLPAPDARCAFLRRWSDTQHLPLRLSAQGLATLTERTGGFSFAYLKELCLSSTMAWAEEGRAGTMDTVALGVCELLRRDVRESNALLGPLPGLERKVGIHA